MIVYRGKNVLFQQDVLNGIIGKKIEDLFVRLGIPREQHAELVSWKNSLSRIANILNCDEISKDIDVAIEFQIPLTSKRVDFMISGNDGKFDNVIVVELKQWEKCTATSRENIVNAYTGGAKRDVPHPSQQVYSDAKLTENFNESLQNNNINLLPCAYLHNYEEKYKEEICHKKYANIIKLAPVFLMEDGTEFRKYIIKYIKKPSDKNLFDIIDEGKLKPSKSLQSAVGSILNGNKEFELVDEQVVAYSTILKLVENSLNSNEKYTVVVQGGPGTGKSVIAVNLLAKILNNGFVCKYVSKNSAPRTAFSYSFVKGKYSLSYLKGLFVGSGSFINCPTKTYDCLLVDEAHRLNEKSGIFSNKGENQIKEIINASKISFFLSMRTK